MIGLLSCRLVLSWRSYGEYEPRLRYLCWTEVTTLSCAGMYR
jgi:hypothetical protein